MDKKTIIGLLLIFAVFIGYSFYTSHTAKKAREEQIAQQMKEEAQKKANDKKTAQLADTLAKDTSALAVDTPNDLERVRAIISRKLERGEVSSK